MERLSKYSLKIVYTCDIEDHTDLNGYCSDLDESNLDQVYRVQKTDTIRLYHSGNKYITDNFYDRYLMHNPGFIVPDSDLIDIFCDDLMNDKIVTYFTNYYTKIGCSSGGSGVCGAREIFNVVIISIELLSHNE